MNDINLKKIVFLLFFLNFSMFSFAQIQSVELGINGLTCSQCSRSVELKLNKLSFIQDISMDLENTNAIISFKKNQKVDLSAIAKAVKDAGFSVRMLFFTINSNDVDLSKNCFKIKKDAFNIVGKQDLESGKIVFQLLGKEYMSNKDWKRISLKSNAECIGETTYYIKYIK